MIALLTAPETLNQPEQAHRFMAQLASIETELDACGVTVPATTKMLDVVVSDPSFEAIEFLISSVDWLKGYSLKSFWQPEDGCTEF